MRLFNKAVIVGTGLIGGSIGLAMKKASVAKEIVGMSRRKESLSLAKKIGAVDAVSCDIRIVKDADLVIFALPPDVILDLAPKFSQFTKDDCIIFDVASAKEAIVAKLDKLFPNYLGTHPLAGSEKQGVKYSDADMFQNSVCILTPTKNTDRLTLQKVRRLWLKIGAKVINLSAQKHDKILSFVSHLPHITAFSLVNSVRPEYLKFASGSFKDVTRVAASGSLLWGEIFLSNQRNLLSAIELFQDNLERIKSAIKNKDKLALGKILEKARQKRISLNYDYRY